MIHVAAAILRRDGKLYICQRGPGGICAHLWEFPGGKIEPGESPEACVIRECQEELGISISIVREYAHFQYDYPDRSITFTFFLAEIRQGEPAVSVHTKAFWVFPQELLEYPFCPADRSVIQRLAKEVAPS